MRRIVIFLFFALSINLSAQFIGPKIFVPSETFDFGDIVEGQTVNHSFVIVNNGNEVLKITQVLTTCGCTAAEPEKKELKPGESTIIKVDFNSTGRSGKQVKQISVASNDTKNPRIKLVISCNVLDAKTVKEKSKGPKIVFEKTQHDFGKMYEGKIKDYYFKFKNAGKEVLEIKEVKTTCGCTAALVSEKSLKPGEEGTIRVEFDSANRIGRVNRSIIVQSNDPDESFKTLNIYADILKKEN